MFCNLVRAYLEYEKSQSLMALQMIESLRENILYDLHEAIYQSKPLVQKYRDLFNSSNTFLHFLSRLSKIDFVGKEANFDSGKSKIIDDNIKQQIKEISQENENLKLEFNKKELYEFKNNNLTLKIKFKEEENKQLKDKLKECTERNTQLDVNLNNCNEDKTKLELEIAQLKQKIKECDQNNIQLNNKIKECNESKNVLEGENIQLKNKLGDETRVVVEENSSDNFNKIKNSYETLLSENKKCLQEIQNLKRHGLDLKAENDNLKLNQGIYFEELSKIRHENDILNQNLIEHNNSKQLAIQQVKNECDQEVTRINQQYNAEYSNWQGIVGFIIDFTNVMQLFENLDINGLDPNIQFYIQKMRDALINFKERYENVFGRYNIPLSSPMALETEAEAIVLPPPPPPPTPIQTLTIQEIQEVTNNLYLNWKDQESKADLQNRYNALEKNVQSMQNKHNIEIQNLSSEHNLHVQNLTSQHESMRKDLELQVQEMSNLMKDLNTTNSELRNELQECQEHVKNLEKDIENKKISIETINVMDSIKDEIDNPLINDAISKLYRELCLILEKQEVHSDVNSMLVYIHQITINCANKFKKLQDMLKFIKKIDDPNVETDVDIKVNELLKDYNYIKQLLYVTYDKLNKVILLPYTLNEPVVNIYISFNKIIDNVITYCSELLKNFEDSTYRLKKLVVTKPKKVKITNLHYLISDMNSIITELEKRFSKPELEKKRNAPLDDKSPSPKRNKPMDLDSISTVIKINDLLVMKYFEIFYDYVVTKNYKSEELTVLYEKLTKVESSDDYQNFLMSQIAIVDSLINEKEKLDDNFYEIFTNVDEEMVRFFDNAQNKIINYIREYAKTKI